MANYKIFETIEYRNNLSKIFQKIREQIERKTRSYVYPQIRQIPQFGINIKKLQNYDPETWRYRIGDYRIFYTIDEKNKLVNIITIEPRKDAY